MVPKHYQSSDSDDKNQRQLSPNATVSHLPGGMCNLKRNLSLSVKLPLYIVSVRGKDKGQSIQLDQTLEHPLNLNKYNPGRLELDTCLTLQGV